MGALLSPYVLQRALGVSSSGSVRLARRRRSDDDGAAPLAIKRVRHWFDDGSLRARMRQGAEDCLGVRHPNVVAVHAVADAGDEMLVTMDYVDGSSLASLVAGGRVPLGVVVRIVLDACAGIEAIHAATDRTGAGLVHGNLRPQNILVGLDGVAKVTDFALRTDLAGPHHMTRMLGLGKLGYLAPEFLLSGAATQQGDVFVLGTILWEALAGQRLFYGATAFDTIRLTAVTDVPSLRKSPVFDPRIGQALDATVQRALARGPCDRFASVAAFAEALRAATVGLVASASEVASHVAASVDVRPPVPPVDPATMGSDQSWARGTNGLVGLTLLAAIVLGAVAVAHAAPRHPRTTPTLEQAYLGPSTPSNRLSSPIVPAQ